MHLLCHNDKRLEYHIYLDDNIDILVFYDFSYLDYKLFDKFSENEVFES